MILFAGDFINKPDLNHWKDRLDYTNRQISMLDDELEVLKQKESEKQYNNPEAFYVWIN